MKNIKFITLILIFLIFILVNPYGICLNISQFNLKNPIMPFDDNIGIQNNNFISGNKEESIGNYKSLNDAFVLKDSDPSEGYTLFAPEYSKYTYLINNNKKIVHLWKSDYIDCLGHYLTEDGYLVRMCLPRPNPTFMSGGISGRVETFDNNSNLVWEFEYTTDKYCLHHDIEILPNGNILMIAWEYKTYNEAIAAGRNPDKLSDALWPDHIIEVKPIGISEYDIVWEWYLWDHLIQDYDPSKENYGVVEDHPELVDLNYGNSNRDWTHFNSLDYNENFDQILISAHNFNEIWIIDHSTTTAEASGHSGGDSGKGGDILYRWGNPIAYRAGDLSDQKFIGQHYAQWVDYGYPGEGNILVFNNGVRNRGYSSVDEIIPPVDIDGNYYLEPGLSYGPDEQLWIYTDDNPEDLFSMIMSSVQRLANGNTLICSATQGWILEVTPEKNIIWDYTNIFPTPLTNTVFKAERYSPDYPGIPENQNLNLKWEKINGLYNEIRFKLVGYLFQYFK